MQRFSVNDIMKDLKNILSKDELDFLSNNVSYFSSNGMIYPLKSKKDEKINLDTFITSASKHSADLLKRISKVLRNYISNKANILTKHYYYQVEIKEFYKFRDKGYLEDAIDACKEQIKIAKEMIEEFRTEKLLNEELIIQLENANKEIEKSITGNDSISNMMKSHYEEGIRNINELKNKKPKSWEEYTGPVHVGYKQLCIIYEKLGKYNEAIELAEKAKSEKWSEDWDKRIEKLKKKTKKT